MSTIIKTFSDDIYIIKDKTPDEVATAIKGMDDVRMPNGSYIHRKAIASMQSYEDYAFQTEQKERHKKGQYLHGGKWYDKSGDLGISAQLERVTGELKKKIGDGNRQQS